MYLVRTNSEFPFAVSLIDEEAPFGDARAKGGNDDELNFQQEALKLALQYFKGLKNSRDNLSHQDNKTSRRNHLFPEVILVD